MGLPVEEEEVWGWGVAKGDPGVELACRISSDMGRELRRGAISYLEYKLGNNPGLPTFDLSSVLGVLVIDFLGGITFS
jgi:hypothetical protein